MTVSFDLSTDFEDVADGLEAVTLDRRGSSSNVSIGSALRRNLSTREVADSDGKYQAGDLRWHFGVAEVSDDPALGDAIVDAAGERWTILAVRCDTLCNRWRCITRDLAIVYGLDDTVTIEQATYSKGTAGEMEPTYTVWRTGVRARIQEIAVEPGTDAGAQWPGKQYRIYLQDDYGLDQTHRIQDREGNWYRIRRVTGKAALDQLCEVEATPWR